MYKIVDCVLQSQKSAFSFSCLRTDYTIFLYYLRQKSDANIENNL